MAERSQMIEFLGARGVVFMRKLASTVFILTVIGFGGKAASAQSCTTATCKAASPSESDVLAALPSRNNQNPTVTVMIPTGTSAWNSQLNYTVPSAVTDLTIQGQTTVSCTGTAGTSAYACTHSDKTIIQDNYQSSGALLRINLDNSSAYLRITGISLEGGTTGGNVKYGGVIVISGSTHNLRIDHNYFDGNTYSPKNSAQMVRIYGDVEGVVDHNVVDQYLNSFVGAFNNIGDSIGDGDGTFANPTDWGSAKFIFIEDNVINSGAVDDCAQAGSFVARYNTFVEGVASGLAVQNHATKSDVVPWRGCRAFAVYHNYFTSQSGIQGYVVVSSKGTTSLIWGNTVASGAYGHFIVPETDRNGITGDEKATPTGWGTCGASTNPRGGAAGPSNWDGNSTSYGYPCLDGVGRGQTLQALNGASSQTNHVNSVTGSIAWPQQLLEPIYSFDNTLNGTPMWYTLDHVTQENRDVYFDCGTSSDSCSSFDGTKGTGSGLLANRPSTCTAGPGGKYGQSPTGSYGVAYWATDVNGGQGELYVCTATNTWTAVYEPYPYPHPLASGVVTQSNNSVAAPTSLTATVQ